MSSHFAFLKALIPLFSLSLIVCYLITSVSSSLTRHTASRRLFTLHTSLQSRDLIFSFHKRGVCLLLKTDALLLRLPPTFDVSYSCPDVKETAQHARVHYKQESFLMLVPDVLVCDPQENI